MFRPSAFTVSLLIAISARLAAAQAPDAEGPPVPGEEARSSDPSSRGANAPDALASVAYRREFALCIGVDGYLAGSGFKPLRYAGRDAVALAVSLLENCDFDKVVLVTDAAVAPDLGEKYPDRLTIVNAATCEAIEGQARRFFLDAKNDNDVVLFYFAGHGVANVFASLVPSDYHETLAPEKLIDVGLMVRCVTDRVRAQNRLVILDACRTTPGGGGRTIDATFQRALIAGGERLALWSACSDGESAVEDPALEHGRFTWALLEALQGDAFAQGEAHLRVGDVFDYVKDVFEQKIAEGSWSRQVPQELAGFRPAFALASREVPEAPPPAVAHQSVEELLAQATRHYALNQLETADAICRRALAAASGGESVAEEFLGHLMARRALILYRLGKLEQSAALAQAAAAFVADAAALVELDGYRRLDAEDYDGAQASLRRAIELTADPKDVAPFVWTQLGLCQLQLEEFAVARDSFEAAVARCRELALAESHPDYRESLGRLAATNEQLQQLARAETDFRQPGESVEPPQAGTLEYAEGLEELAEAYYSYGDNQQAMWLYGRALEIRRTIRDESDAQFPRSLMKLATLHEEMGDREGAEPMYVEALRALEIAIQYAPDDAALWLDLGRAYATRGDYEKAIVNYGHALLINPNEPQPYLERGAVYELLGVRGGGARDFNQAERDYSAAVRLTAESPGGDVSLAARSLTALGALSERLGNFSAASLNYQRALAMISEELEIKSVGMTEQQMLLYGARQRSYLDSWLNCLIQLQNEDDADNAYRLAMLWKGATQVRQRAVRRAAGDSEIAAQMARLQVLIPEMAILSERAADDDATALQRLERVREEVNELERAIAARIPAVLKDGPDDAFGTLERVTAALPADAALIDYFEFWRLPLAPPPAAPPEKQRWLAAFVVRPGERAVLVDLGPQQPVADALAAWQETYGESQQGRRAAQTLKEHLWEPLDGAIGDADTLLLSPDGVLAGVPWNALPGKAPDSYLIEDCRLSLIPAPRLIPALASEPAKKPDFECLLVGGVDYSAHVEPPWIGRDGLPADRGPVGRAGLQWSALPGAAREVEVINGLFRELFDFEQDEVILLTRSDATERRVCELAPRCAIIHFATHSFSQGGMNGVVLAGANDARVRIDRPSDAPADADDGYLMADEIAALSLENVLLAVVSSGEPSDVRDIPGEGRMGLQRAFHVAGARAVIGSLWVMSDADAEMLMVQFYRHYLDDEMSPLDALRSAQLWMLRRPAPARAAPAVDEGPGAHPLDDDGSSQRPPIRSWAGFFLSGDWR